MDLKETIQSDLKEALKSKQTQKLEALRLLSSAIKNLEIEKKKTSLTNADVLAVIKKQLKQYEEVVQQYVDADRTTEAEEDLTKMEYLKEYLPPQLSHEELSLVVSKVILSLKAKGLFDQGPVIKEVQKRTQGNADGVQIAQLVREQLQQL